jgi:hypothetical protein
LCSRAADQSRTGLPAERRARLRPAGQTVRYFPCAWSRPNVQSGRITCTGLPAIRRDVSTFRGPQPYRLRTRSGPGHRRPLVDCRLVLPPPPRGSSARDRMFGILTSRRHTMAITDAPVLVDFLANLQNGRVLWPT